MTLMNRAVNAILGATIGSSRLLAVLATPAGAQVGKLVDANMATESELTALPHMTPAIVKAMIEKRPFKTVVDLNKFLLEQKLTQDQAKEFYAKAFVPINLNTGTKEEFLLIPRRRRPHVGGIRGIPALEDLGTVRQGDRQICRPAGDRPAEAVLLPPHQLRPARKIAAGTFPEFRSMVP